MRYTAFLPHLLALFAVFAAPLGAEPLSVVTTLPDYAVLARAVGGERVSVRSIVRGDQDAHFIRPKPSFATMVANADVLVATGLDLELWLPTVVNKAGNPRVRSGEPGFVATSHGMRLLEKPTKFSASEGHVHVYGNPHITTSPLLMKVAAANIAEGFITNDSAGADFYRANLRRFCDEIDRRLFGAELVKLLGGKTLTKLVEKGRLMSFLKKHSFGKPKRPLLDYLGGWMKKMAPLRGRALVTYHKNWVYFFEIFGLCEAGTIEPKPGIPPSPKHTAQIITMMKARGIRVILAANYFNTARVRDAADAVGGRPVIVPYYVGGAPGADDYFALVDTWVNSLLEAMTSSGTRKEK